MGVGLFDFIYLLVLYCDLKYISYEKVEAWALCD
jgi:hypothetical protein